MSVALIKPIRSIQKCCLNCLCSSSPKLLNWPPFYGYQCYVCIWSAACPGHRKSWRAATSSRVLPFQDIDRTQDQEQRWHWGHTPVHSGIRVMETRGITLSKQYPWMWSLKTKDLGEVKGGLDLVNLFPSSRCYLISSKSQYLMSQQPFNGQFPFHNETGTR